MLIFVNERPLEVPDGTTAGEAVHAFDPELGNELAGGRALATDGVGRPAAPAAILVPGAILKVRRSAKPGGTKA